MITIDELTKSFGDRVLFENVSAIFRPGNRYGLTGPNGAGKSTFLKILMGLDEADKGSIQLPKKVGYLRQNIEDFRDFTALDCVIMGNDRLWKALQERDKLYDEEMTDEIGMRLAELEEIVADEDGYSAESDAAELLEGMGLESALHEKKLSELPNDFQFRALLCQALFGKPEALLLDEPTNHLDLTSISWLENFFMEFHGTLVVVSHDRHFLNSVATHIADIDYDTLIIYPGNYDEMVAAKSQARGQVEQELKSKEKKVAQMKAYIERFGSGTRAARVQSRAKALKKMDLPELKKSNITRPYIYFPPPEKMGGKVSIEVAGVKKSFDHPVITGFSKEIYRGDKIGIIGSNGMGKTTLLKMIAKVLEPDHGKVEAGHQIKMGYFPQEHSELIDPTEDVNLFEWLKRCFEKVEDTEVRSALGKMLFSGDDAFKKVGELSGGERARLILAKLTLEMPNVLVLDEPNNHLDLESVSALAEALDYFPGTVIVVSHDRDLLDSVCKQIIAIDKEGVHFFDGPLEDYLAK